MMCSIEDTTQMLEDTKNNLAVEITAMEEKSEGHKKILADLKAKLYAKFGTNINLEAEDDS